MSELPPVLVGALAGALLVAVVALAVVSRTRTRARVEAEAARAEAAALRHRLDAVEQRLASARTSVPAASPTYVARVVDEVPGDRELVGGSAVAAPVFADLVLRESVIRLASLAHGVRRAVAPAQRNRIRFEMSREVKRSRRARRDEMKAALRDYQARQRAAQADPREDAA